MLPNTPILSLKALTWVRDNHGLFDYETLELKKKTLELKGNCKIVRCGCNVGILGEVDTSEGEEIEEIADIKVQDGGIRF